MSFFLWVQTNRIVTCGDMCYFLEKKSFLMKLPYQYGIPPLNLSPSFALSRWQWANSEVFRSLGAPKSSGLLEFWSLGAPKSSEVCPRSRGSRMPPSFPQTFDPALSDKESVSRQTNTLLGLPGTKLLNQNCPMPWNLRSFAAAESPGNRGHWIPNHMCLWIGIIPVSFILQNCLSRVFDSC